MAAAEEVAMRDVVAVLSLNGCGLVNFACTALKAFGADKDAGRSTAFPERVFFVATTGAGALTCPIGIR